MAEVDFHTGLADKVGYACRLLRKAWRRRSRVVVAGNDALLGQLDTALWTFDPQDFVPHARLARGASVAPGLERTPIWLVERGAAPPHRDVLVNLGPQAAEAAESFARVIELVDTSDDDRAAGRARWNAYKAAGWTVRHQVPATTTP
jgi:DNA polymerase-3 subunit chi